MAKKDTHPKDKAEQAETGTQPPGDLAQELASAKLRIAALEQDVINERRALEEAQQKLTRATHLSTILSGEIGKGGPDETPDQALVRVLGTADLGNQLVTALSAVAGDHGDTEGAVECVQRIIRERTELQERVKAGIPATGWASEQARQLVLMVPPQDRYLFLGDLLAQLQPFVAEHGANETAADVLRRKLAEIPILEDMLKSAEKQVYDAAASVVTLKKDIARVQSAMVARRAPEVMGAATLDHMTTVLVGAGMNPADHGGVVGTMEQVLSERKGMRSFLSTQPLVAVAVRDDSTAELKDRYSLLVLEWNGKDLSVTTLDRRQAWGNIHTQMRTAIATRLIPTAFRE